MIEQSTVDTAISTTDASQHSVEQLWLSLPEEIREICLIFGGIPFSKESLFGIVDDPDGFIKTLTDPNLLEEVSQHQLYQEASQKITHERNATVTLPRGSEPPYTAEELSARDALYHLKAYQNNPELYPDFTKPLFFRFSKEFSRLVQSLDVSGRHKKDMSFTQPQSINIFGWRWETVSKVELLEYLNGHVANDRADLLSISTANPEQVMLAQRDQAFFQTVKKEFDLVLPDGEGIVLASRLLSSRNNGQVINSRLAGVEIVVELMSLPRSNLGSILVIGGRDYQDSKIKVASGELRLQNMAETTQLAKNSTDKLIFWLPAYEDASCPTVEEEAMVERQVGKLKPRLVFVALGAPQQEFWVAKHKQLLASAGVKIVMVVGGAFDMLTDKVPRAPEFMRQLKLEWLWRLLQEPSRWRRQLALFQFVLHVFKQRFI